MNEQVGPKICLANSYPLQPALKDMGFSAKCSSSSSCCRDKVLLLHSNEGFCNQHCRSVSRRSSSELSATFSNHFVNSDIGV
mmetsp:Transcript_7094/g.15306  ORF Transcript_7094/g.15306 Transcript_7094/m.15306 type:complete len:82 (+) Transcript_7094:51-296(+)